MYVIYIGMKNECAEEGDVRASMFTQWFSDAPVTSELRSNISWRVSLLQLCSLCHPYFNAWLQTPEVSR